MTYNLLTIDAVSPEVMALALAGCLGIAVGDVDVADSDGDPDLRNWDAPVSCEYRAVRGDVAWSLDVYAQEEAADQPPEADVAAGFAKAVMTTVLFPAEEAPPSAYWAVTPEGLLTRARLELSDDEPPFYEVTAVEAPVPQLPRATVTRFAEIVREQRPDTPVAWAFAASVVKVRQAASGLARLSSTTAPAAPSGPRRATWWCGRGSSRKWNLRGHHRGGTRPTSTGSGWNLATSWPESVPACLVTSPSCSTRPWNSWTGGSSLRQRTTRQGASAGNWREDPQSRPRSAGGGTAARIPHLGKLRAGDHRHRSRVTHAVICMSGGDSLSVLNRVVGVW